MGQDERREPRSAVFLLYTAVPPLVRPDPGRWSVGVLLSEIRYVSLREAPYIYIVLEQSAERESES